MHGNIQRDGTFSVVPRMSGGDTTAAGLRRIADTVDRFDIPMVKVTGGQRIDLLGVRKEDLPAVWADLDMPSGHACARSMRTVTCVGTDFCRFGPADSTRLGIDIEERFKGLESPVKIELAVPGCPRNRAEATVRDAGLVAAGDDRAHDVGGDQMAVFHLRDGTLRATQAVCPHAGGPLADGQIDPHARLPAAPADGLPRRRWVRRGGTDRGASCPGGGGAHRR